MTDILKPLDKSACKHCKFSHTGYFGAITCDLEAASRIFEAANLQVSLINLARRRATFSSGSHDGLILIPKDCPSPKISKIATAGTTVIVFERTD